MKGAAAPDCACVVIIEWDCNALVLPPYHRGDYHARAKYKVLKIHFPTMNLVNEEKDLGMVTLSRLFNVRG